MLTQVSVLLGWQLALCSSVYFDHIDVCKLFFTFPLPGMEGKFLLISYRDVSMSGKQIAGRFAASALPVFSSWTMVDWVPFLGSSRQL
jgi:hypothetical protein